MSQYDAAAMPMYAAFGTTAEVTKFDVISPLIDVNVRNKKGDYGAEESRKMDFSDVDRAPMHVLNEVIWKSVEGAASAMPPPVHRLRPLIDAADLVERDDDLDRQRALLRSN